MLLSDSGLKLGSVQSKSAGIC